MNVDYLAEVFAGDSVRIVSRLIDCDNKRIRYFHEMHHATNAYIAATNEIFAMHVNMGTRRSEPFPLDIQTRLARMKSAHTALPLSPLVGRKLGIRMTERDDAGFGLDPLLNPYNFLDLTPLGRPEEEGIMRWLRHHHKY